ncbi:DNA-binding barrel domain superfamily [Sesbania bispinosa]|nr:DNA-binding barrel domain superfamily [Sesbania bispinosa]
MHSHRMLKVLYMQKIPNNFTRKYGGDMSNPILLKPPDGTEWKMNWTKHDGDIWLQEGWKEFATHYSLDYGHMVLFEYKDTSHFEVHIFDKTTLEIQYPFHASQDEQDNIDQISDESVEILDNQPPSTCKKTTSKSCPQPRRKLRTGTSGGVGSSPKLQNSPEHANIKEDVSRTTQCQKVDQLNSKIYEALNRAEAFRSKYPSFIVVMKPSYVGRGNLVLDGRTWHGRYIFRKVGRYSNVQVTSGWKKFASDNNLKEGDVCLFELTKSRPLSFKVLIFRVGEEPHSLPPQESVEEPHSPSPQGEATQRTSLHPITGGALKEANKFTSENPFFKVYIKPSSTKIYRPRVPVTFLNKKKKTLMLQIGKKLWPVRVLRYPYEGSSKLSGGWTRFARENKLLDGDVCVFELINNRKDAVFHVHIFRGHC